jgi:hypothetical protein
MPAFIGAKSGASETRNIGRPKFRHQHRTAS